MAISKRRSQSVILLCLGAAIPLFGAQQQAVASESIRFSATDPREILFSAPQSLETKPLELAHLGEPLPYLRLEDKYFRTRPLASHLVIKLSERLVYVYQDDYLLATYPIAVGKAGWETPTGNYEVLQKQRDPAWQHPWNGSVIPPGPENPLGDRWIGFWTDGKNYIGFHGTPNEELVGQAVSHGCIRMRNDDVRALFEKVALGTTVVVEQ